MMVNPQQPQPQQQEQQEQEVVGYSGAGSPAEEEVVARQNAGNVQRNESLANFIEMYVVGWGNPVVRGTSRRTR